MVRTNGVFSGEVMKLHLLAELVSHIKHYALILLLKSISIALLMLLFLQEEIEKGLIIRVLA